MRFFLVSKHDLRQPDAVQRRQPKPRREVVDKSAIQRMRQQLADQRGAGTRRAKDENQRMLNLKIAVLPNFQRLKRAVHFQKKVFFSGVFLVVAFAFLIKTCEGGGLHFHKCKSIWSIINISTMTNAQY